MKDNISNSKLLKLQRLLKERKRKVSASVTVAGEVMDGVNLLVPAKQRSRFFETALRRELRRRLRQARNAQDLSVLNARAAHLDRETDDLLDIQSDPFE
jgi:hypothetical protein